MSEDGPPLPAAAFYEPLDQDRFTSTTATAGPWSPGFQHAGPVSALVGRAFERHDPSPGTRVARVTVEILGPVPVAPLRAVVRTVRPGRRVSLLEGELLGEDGPIVRATAWRIAAAPGRLESTDHSPPPPPLPTTSRPIDRWPGMHADGYLAAMEWRPVEGSFNRPGPGAVWARARVPLVAGEADSPLVRALTLADSASGIGSQLDLAKWLIINTDLTVALHRDPVGEWIFMRARINADPGGSALAEARLADSSGGFGRALQTLLVDGLPAG
ncbi:thioesterase family protein [Actinomadura vinacea]|uniref:Thioesterase family protein n=1 Tax=Actinomadura vinacea TaxID=115336 RepID=A0ABP5XDD4_9ACTN